MATEAGRLQLWSLSLPAPQAARRKFPEASTREKASPVRFLKLNQLEMSKGAGKWPETWALGLGLGGGQVYLLTFTLTVIPAFPF